MAKEQYVEVQVTQYMRPSGLPVARNTDIPQRLFGNYQDMRRAGHRLAAEVLTTREVSLTVENADEDVDVELVKNGPEVQAGICRMLERAKWRRTTDEAKADGSPF